VPLNRRFDIEHVHDRRENILFRGWLRYWRNGAKLCAIGLEHIVVSAVSFWTMVSHGGEGHERVDEQQLSRQRHKCTNLNDHRWSPGRW
jgi:hypothetical protein